MGMSVLSSQWTSSTVVPTNYWIPSETYCRCKKYDSSENIQEGWSEIGNENEKSDPPIAYINYTNYKAWN